MTHLEMRKERALRTCDGSISLGPTRKSLGTTVPFMAKRIAYWALAGTCLAATAGCGSLPGLGSPGDNTKPLKPEQAVDQLTETRAQLALAPHEPYWSFRMGELYAAADSAALAMQYLQKSLALDGSYEPAAALLSKLYYDAGMFAQGVDLLDGFVTRNPQASADIRAALALQLEAAGEPDRADAVIAQGGTESEAALQVRTYMTLRGQDPKSALASAKQALDADDASAANHNNYGIALLHAGRPVEAREHFKNALSIDDQLPGALYNMAIVEAFYFFDDAAGREWFAKYKKVASDDPDDLAARFGAKVTASGNAPKQP